jgi:hypothetical protein
MEQDEISNCQKDLFGKRPVEEKHARTAEDVAKDAATTLPPELAKASTKKSKLKAVETQGDGEDARKETGYQ